jgi:hypothetical protein
MEGWVGQIRDAAGAPVGTVASISVITYPQDVFSATPITLSATVVGCDPVLYQFECGDSPGAFDDGESVGNSHICDPLSPGTYTLGVRAEGGTCDAPVTGSAELTVSLPPAPVWQ